MQLATWLANASRCLQTTHSESPKLDAEVLASWVLQRNRAWLYGFGDHILSSSELERLNQALAQRQQGQPIAYITGEREFWTLNLQTHPSTLIPRADTETLVEWALELPLPAAAKVLDLGTGTGAIALALASERPQWQVQGADIQAPAVELAQRNARLNYLERVSFVQSDWFSAVAGRFDLIVSNPPYIDGEDEHLQQGDVRFEPHSALVAENAGLADIQQLIQQAPSFLEAQGWLLLEHGYQQGSEVQALLEQQGFAEVQTRCDLAGQPRITGGLWLE